MTVYVAEIAGRGIVAFGAADDIKAEARIADKPFLRDLIVLQNEGRPLWDGVSKIQLRKAAPREAETWQAGRAVAGQSGSTGDDEDRSVFLVPVVDPSRFADDGDDDDDRDDHDHGD